MTVNLEAFDAAFSSAEAPEAQAFDIVPNGKYPSHVEKIEIVETKTGQYAGQPRLSWHLVIDSGPCAGRYLFHSNRIADDPKIMGWLKSDLAVVGLKLGRLSELTGRLGEILDRRVFVTVKNTSKGGKEYQNTYLNAAIIESEAGDVSSAGGGGDIPF